MADIRLCHSADPLAGESGLLTSAFYDYVRGLSDEVPAGYSENGMRLYRHLVYLGADQMLGGYSPTSNKHWAMKAGALCCVHLFRVLPGNRIFMEI